VRTKALVVRCCSGLWAETKEVAAVIVHNQFDRCMECVYVCRGKGGGAKGSSASKPTGEVCNQGLCTQMALLSLLYASPEEVAPGGFDKKFFGGSVTLHVN